jgi:hypothetical protein
MNPQQIIAYVFGLKLTRYGLMFASGVIAGNWLGQQYPAQSAAFWAMPSTALIAAIAGLWLSHAKTVKNEKIGDIRNAAALAMDPPQSEQDAAAALACLKEIK